MASNSMGEGNIQQIDDKENKPSWLKRAGLVLGLAGAINGADMNKQDVESTVDTTKSALSSLISTSTASAATLDGNKIVINQDIETVDGTGDISKNEALNEIFKGLNLDEVTKSKVLDNLKKVYNNEVLGAITTIPATGGSIEIQKNGEDIIMLVDKGGVSELKEGNKLEISIKDSKKSPNSPITMSSNGVTYEVKKEGTMFLAGAVVNGEREAARVGVTSKVSENAALGLMADLGPDLYRIIASIGLEVGDNGQLIFMGEHLTQTQDISTQLMGILEEKISQNKLGFEYKQKLGEGFVEYLVLRGYVSKADSKELLSREFQTEDANFIRIYRQILSIEGGTGAGLEGGVGFKLNEKNKIEITLDADSLDFGDLGKETGIGVNTRFTSESLGHGIRVYLEGGVGNEVRGNMVGAGASVPLENLGRKTGIEDLRARVGVIHTIGGIGEDNTTPFVGLTGRFGGDKKMDDVTRNNLEKGNRLTRDIEGSTQKPTGNMTEDMMNSMERFTTNGDIKVKVGEKTELVSETEKPKPVVEKPKKPENKDTLEANDDSFSTNKNTEINGLDVLSNDSRGAKLTGKFRGQTGGEFTVDSGKINFKPTNDFVGPASAEYEVELNGKTDWAKVTINVKGGDTPPETPETPSPTSSFASGSVTKTVGDGAFTNTFTTNSPGVITYSSSNTSVATVNSSTGEVTIVGAGSAEITASQAAATGFKADTDKYNLTVEGAANNAPTGPALSDATRGDNGGFSPISPISTSDGVSDLEGNTLTYSASGLPAGLSIDPSTGEITGLYDAGGPESFSVTVTVSDGNGGTLVRTFTLTITDQG